MPCTTSGSATISAMRLARIERGVGVLKDRLDTACQHAAVDVRRSECHRTGSRPRTAAARPSIMRASVVLPEPDSPTIASTSPARSCSETSSTARSVSGRRPDRGRAETRALTSRHSISAALPRKLVGRCRRRQRHVATMSARIAASMWPQARTRERSDRCVRCNRTVGYLADRRKPPLPRRSDCGTCSRSMVANQRGHDAGDRAEPRAAGAATECSRAGLWYRDASGVRTSSRSSPSRRCARHTSRRHGPPCARRCRDRG